MKNALEEASSILDNSEERTSDLEDKLVAFTQLEQQKRKKKPRNGPSLRDLLGNIKCAQIHITGVPEGKRVRKTENPFEEIMAGKLC